MLNVINDSTEIHQYLNRDRFLLTYTEFFIEVGCKCELEIKVGTFCSVYGVLTDSKTEINL